MPSTQIACFTGRWLELGTHNIERRDEKASIMMAADPQQMNISIMLSSPQMIQGKVVNLADQKLLPSM